MIGPLPCSRPSVTPFSSTHAAATSSALCRSTSTAAFMSIRSSVVSAADTAFSAGSSAGLASAIRGVDRRDDVVGVLQGLVVLEDDELVAGERGAGVAGGLGVLASASPPVPEEPDSPQAAVNASARASGAMNRMRARMSWTPRLLCPVAAAAATRVWAGDLPRGSCNPLRCAQCDPGSVRCRFVSGAPASEGHRADRRLGPGREDRTRPEVHGKAPARPGRRAARRASTSTSSVSSASAAIRIAPAMIRP